MFVLWPYEAFSPSSGKRDAPRVLVHYSPRQSLPGWGSVAALIPNRLCDTAFQYERTGPGSCRTLVCTSCTMYRARRTSVWCICSLANMPCMRWNENPCASLGRCVSFIINATRGVCAILFFELSLHAVAPHEERRCYRTNQADREYYTRLV